jgi:peptidoglycan-associated lipoprotein
MKRWAAFLLALLFGATGADAQLPFLSKRGPQPQQPMLQGIDAQRAEFAAQSGGTTVYFGSESVVLGPPARTTLGLQAAWLRRHPEVVVRIEGYGDGLDTRDHALAVGARRAEEVRSYLVLMGVPAAQVSTTSWGKERPGLGRAVTVLVR